MLVSQLMRKNFPTVVPNESIESAMKKMQENQEHIALVLENDMFRGILTEEQITTAIAANTEAGPAANSDPDRCCYFSDVISDLLVEK